MLLRRSPSWRQSGRAKLANQVQDHLGEQYSGNGYLGQLKGDVPAMADDLRFNLDQLLANSTNVGLWLRADSGGVGRNPTKPTRSTRPDYARHMFRHDGGPPVR